MLPPPPPPGLRILRIIREPPSIEAQLISTIITNDIAVWAGIRRALTAKEKKSGLSCVCDDLLAFLQTLDR